MLLALTRRRHIPASVPGNEISNGHRSPPSLTMAAGAIRTSADCARSPRCELSRNRRRLRGLLLLDSLRLTVVRDPDSTRLQCLGHFTHEVDGQNTVCHPCLANLYMVRKVEPSLETS